MTGDREEGGERLGGWGGRACKVASNCGKRKDKREGGGRGREEVGGEGGKGEI